MIPAGIGLPSYVAIPDTSYSLWPDPQPAARASRRIDCKLQIADLCVNLQIANCNLQFHGRPASPVSIVTDHLRAVAAGEGAVGGDADRLLDEPDRPVAEGEVRPAGVHAPHRNLVELGNQVAFDA